MFLLPCHMERTLQVSSYQVTVVKLMLNKPASKGMKILASQIPNTWIRNQTNSNAIQIKLGLLQSYFHKECLAHTLSQLSQKEVKKALSIILIQMSSSHLNSLILQKMSRTPTHPLPAMRLMNSKQARRLPKLYSSWQTRWQITLIQIPLCSMPNIARSRLRNLIKV